MRGDRARSLAAETRFADVRWVPETQSTNSDGLALARAGAPDGVVLVADHQSAGRGRLDRSWQAPAASSLLVSVLLRPALEPAEAHLTATAVGLAAVDACREVAGVAPSLKWPNDLVIEGDGSRPIGKLGGILAESIVEGSRLEAVVVGLGLNVNWPDDLPPELAGIAVALNAVVGHEIDREDLLGHLLVGLDGWCDRLATSEGRAELVDRYRSACATIGRSVRVERPAGSFEGRAVGLTDDGQLLVEPSGGGGAITEISVGDVVHLRHA
jgi:BirA family biotin operon repressor/biotin-[acetyl-CoA-carboxylase] ligase